MMWKLSILIVLLFIVCNAKPTPSISYISDDQIKRFGDTVELECSVENSSENVVLWMKNSTKSGEMTLLTSGTAMIVPDRRIGMAVDPATSTYILKIQDLREEDEGTYECQVIASMESKISRKVVLSLRRPPKFLSNSTRFTQFIQEGKSVQLECYASGNPQPTITWHREYRALFANGKCEFFILFQEIIEFYHMVNTNQFIQRLSQFLLLSLKMYGTHFKNFVRIL